MIPAILIAGGAGALAGVGAGVIVTRDPAASPRASSSSPMTSASSAKKAELNPDKFAPDGSAWKFPSGFFSAPGSSSYARKGRSASGAYIRHEVKTGLTGTVTATVERSPGGFTAPKKAAANPDDTLARKMGIDYNVRRVFIARLLELRAAAVAVGKADSDYHKSWYEEIGLDEVIAYGGAIVGAALGQPEIAAACIGAYKLAKSQMEGEGGHGAVIRKQNQIFAEARALCSNVDAKAAGVVATVKSDVVTVIDLFAMTKKTGRKFEIFAWIPHE